MNSRLGKAEARLELVRREVERVGLRGEGDAEGGGNDSRGD